MVTADELRGAILKLLDDFHDGEKSKADCRLLHLPAVKHELTKAQDWIRDKYPKYAHFFANGRDISPAEITPKLIQVDETWAEDLFRLARYTWSLPYSRGYGRRIRFLLLDSHNDKLIGIFGLQSPPLNFPARDRMFNYPAERKVQLVNQTMDVFTLGAIPPYNRLLGGKLVALAAASNEVRSVYRRKYEAKTTVISKQIIPAELVALTTTSAFGKSSIYNRLKYKGHFVVQPIGYTEGYGSFHLSIVYPLIREYLEQEGVLTYGGFGNGPKIVWQNINRARQRLNLSDELLKHGIKREVFLFPLINNLSEYMEGKSDTPYYIDQSFDELVDWWKQRWLTRRASSVSDWRAWNKDKILDMLFLPPDVSGPQRLQGVMVSDADAIQPAAEPESAPWDEMIERV
jgi:hypothetical protein